MPNITISIDEDLLKSGRRYAEKPQQIVPRHLVPLASFHLFRRTARCPFEKGFLANGTSQNFL